MRAEELWKAYCEKENIDIDSHYESWEFGNAPDKLADLVLKGMKTATASGYDLYFIEGEEEQLPQPGDYSVILNSKDEAVCIIQTTKTTVIPFDEVSKEHAYKEGEGDRSLAYWRAVHEEFLNLPLDVSTVSFEEGFSRDVTNIGHWGCGAVELYLQSGADFEKAKPLIDRAFDEN